MSNRLDLPVADREGLELQSRRNRWADAQFAALYTEPVKVNAWPACSLMTLVVAICIATGYYILPGVL